jgi:bacillopeptidase F (M6 metalloprotease family)
MQGLDAVDDPANAAYAGRFYTGRMRQWVDETIDLSDYAGQEILLRFEYVTDPILTFGGLALDNIAIPEIGFYDDAETAAAGWTADGFTRAAAYLPQTWHLLLVTFEGDAPVVTELETAANGTLSYTLEASSSTQQPILIVAAASPMTLELAHYRLAFE